MLNREPFLKAIFANPDDVLTRLVFSDLLDEEGNHAWAELIRVECEYKELERTLHENPALRFERMNRLYTLARRRQELLPAVYEGVPEGDSHLGIYTPSQAALCIRVTSDELSNPLGLRLRALSHHPEWYGATRLNVSTGLVKSPEMLQAILTCPVTHRVTWLDLRGRQAELPRDMEHPNFGTPPRTEIRPAITPHMVKALVQMSEACRLTGLDLRDNSLDDDGARPLIESPNLTRINYLQLRSGNSIGGGMWHQLRLRFQGSLVG